MIPRCEPGSRSSCLAAAAPTTRRTEVGHAAAPLASGATCDQMVERTSIQVMPASADGSSSRAGKKVAAILQERCAADAWTAQARQCLFDVKDLRRPTPASST